MNNKKNIHKNPVDLTPTLPVKEFSITKLFSAYSYIYSPDYQFRGESHEAIELICINQGEVTIILDDKEFILKKHQMFFYKYHDRIDQICNDKSYDDRLQYLHQFLPVHCKSVISVDHKEKQCTAAKGHEGN